MRRDLGFIRQESSTCYLNYIIRADCVLNLHKVSRGFMLIIQITSLACKSFFVTVNRTDDDVREAGDKTGSKIRTQES